MLDDIDIPTLFQRPGIKWAQARGAIPGLDRRYGLPDPGSGARRDHRGGPDRPGLPRHHRCRMLILVNPQNPTGRVFTREELATIAGLAERHHMIVIADEIHADLTYAPHRFVPFAPFAPDRRAPTCPGSTCGIWARPRSPGFGTRPG